MDDLDKKVFELFSGRVVPKGATKIKNSANVPTMYWNICWAHTVPPMMRRVAPV